MNEAQLMGSSAHGLTHPEADPSLACIELDLGYTLGLWPVPRPNLLSQSLVQA